MRFVHGNEVKTKGRFFGLLRGFLIKVVALKYWEHAVSDTIKAMLETGRQGHTM